jgi:ATP-dependent helicase/nuclease subunit A
MPNWTKEQQDAINLDGMNLIVSAGAGSGKTAVLTERVIRKLEGGVGIDKLLILTFTNLAAAEMKIRIRKEIKKRIELSEELKKIDSSFITTFDSYSLSLVKKYHYLLNVKNNVNIIESNLLKIKTKEYLDEIMEEEYQERKDDFSKLINDYCVKDDSEIKKTILDINESLNMKYDKDDYLNNYVSNFYNDSFIDNNIKKYLDLIKNVVNEINHNLTKISNYIDTDYYNKLSEIVLPVINSNSYDEIKNSLLFDKLPNLPRGSSEEAKAYKELINEGVKLLRDLTKYSFTELKDTIILTKPYIEAIIRIIKKLDNKLTSYKFDNDLYDFVDICKMAIKLVKDHDNIREEIKNSFNEIMVDEYQDTSDLQEEFIKLISNNNVYVVGDIKQSIYRFRNANPDIFREKYNNYSKGINGKKIDLLKNFRSRKEVLNNINLVFNFVMNELIGGAEYTESHQMIPGNISYDNEGKNNENHNLDIKTYEYDKELGFTKEEIESFIIANDIIDKVNNHYQVFDKDLNKLRDVTYNDFSILIDRSTSFTTFKKVFLYKQIPLSIYKDESINNSSLFLVIRNIFKLINLVYEKLNNKELEYCYLSIGRSFLYQYSDDELFNVIVNNDYNNTDIFKKINKIVDGISSKSISNILDEIINEFDIYNKLRRINDILNNYVEIEYLYNLSDNLNKMGYTFKDFDLYLESVLDSENEIKYSVNKEDGLSVKIMTIHASKGLEYPICYFPGLYKTFNDRDIKSRIIFNNLLGIISPYYSEGLDNTFYKELLKNNYYVEEISEKIRLFYVALTRVKEKIIFVLPNEDMEEEYENDIVSDSIRMKYRSFSDIVNSIKSKLMDYIETIDINNLGLSKDYNLINSHNLFDNINKIGEKINIIDYPKYELIEKEESHFSKSSSKIFTKEEKDKMEFGTKIHYYLETLDLHNPDLSDIENEYKEKIEAFLNSGLVKDIKEAKVYQEYEFIEVSDDEEKHGVIDLMIEYSNHIDIIDYKLKNIDDEAYVKQLNGYRDYINNISGKETNIYLYSIMDSVYKKVNE